MKEMVKDARQEKSDKKKEKQEADQVISPSVELFCRFCNQECSPVIKIFYKIYLNAVVIILFYVMYICMSINVLNYNKCCG
jgi:hypothetical protein